MKKISKKLNLDRETLLPLTSDELDGVNGGITPATGGLTTACTTRIPTQLSCFLCQQTKQDQR